MEISSTDFEKLKELEESMWIAETRFDKEYMERTLASDFFEFGRSGRTYKKGDTMNAPAQEIRASLPLKNFAIKLIDSNVALVTYISEVAYDTLEVANRSSIWLKTSEGWQFKFHQGTPIFSP